LDVMREYGTDAFRFTLVSMAAMGRDIKLSQERIIGYQNFVNKLWNAARFVLMNVSETVLQETEPVDFDEEASLPNEWILSRLDFTVSEARKALDAYRFNDYANVLYRFTWHEFCDWYVEFSKHLLIGKATNDALRTQRVLLKVFKDTLRMLHPVMPFVTEEIWQKLIPGKGSIVIEPYPVAKRDQEVVNPRLGEMELLTGVIRAVRNLRTEMNCPPGKQVKVILYGREEDLALLRSQEPYLRSLARVAEAEYLISGERPKGAATAVVGAVEVYLPFGEMINLDEELARLTKEINKIQEDLSRVQKKLANREFLNKAREEIVQKEREKAVQYEEKIQTLNLSLKRIQDVQAGRS
jgi:valyl-tRNA synthetase